MPSRAVLSALIVVAGLGISGCTEAPSGGSEVISDGVGDIRAKWSNVDTKTAAPTEPRVSVEATLPSQGSLPALAAGRVTGPSAPAVATVWSAGAVGPDEGVALNVDEGESAVSDLASVGDTTYALGARWNTGTLEPFLHASADRETWTKVDLPADVIDRDIVLSQVAGESSAGPFVVGVDKEDKVAVVMIDTGEIVTLPTPDYGRITGVDAAVASKRALVVLVEVERKEGGQEVVPFTSKDGGASWNPQLSLPSTQPTVYGVVAVKDGFLATGYSLRGTDYLAAAWSSQDGATWSVETDLPSVPGHDAGWSSWASAPTVAGGAVYAAISDGQLLHGTVVRRSPAGRWSTFAKMPAWRTPGASAAVVADGANIVGMRSWNGLLQTGTFTPQGRWRVTGESGAVPAVDSWETAGQVGEETVLVGAHTEVEVTSDEVWSRTSALTPFTLSDGALESTGWQPKEIAGTSGMAAATDNAGNAFVAAQELSVSDDPAVSDESDVVGWFRAAGDPDWKPASGLAGPRTEFVTAAAFHDGEWAVIGVDRASFVGSDHSYGALWTSADGIAWKRAKGPFEVSTTANSWLNGTCVLPGGDLMAVGGVEDSSTGSRGVAFRRAKGVWKEVKTTSLGADVTNFDSCAGTDEVVLLQGTSGGRDTVWSTTDATTFTPVEVGGTKDNVGTVKTIEGGFVAPGGIYSGLQQRAVVWLSGDGKTWHAIDVPADRVLSATDVVPTESGVVVALTGLNGPAVSMLENANELIR